MKEVASWSKPDGVPGLIGRKKVDWSIFEDGTTIPLEFHVDFREANNGFSPARGESVEVYLLIDGAAYVARLVNVDRAVASDTLQIRYDSNQPLKRLLAERLHLTYSYLLSERARRRTADSQKLFVECPDALQSTIDFVAMGVPFHYRLEFHPAIPTR